jgi:Ser/Thr protein kinase RdoA (MazF antagonist)
VRRERHNERAVLSTSVVVRSLIDDWGMTDPLVTPHDGGMNSQTWFVTDGSGRWVAKAVPRAAHRRFVGGLAVAVHAASSGIPVGRPRPTLAGRPFTFIDGVPLALLGFVEGQGIDGRSAAEQRTMGRTLARVHLALIGAEVPEVDRFHWLDLSAPHLGIRPWVRPAVEGALAAWEGIPPRSLTWSLLHTDPAPEAFRWDTNAGVCGLIDWDTGMFGPLMYDVASAVMYLGGPQQAGPFVSAYLGEGVIDSSELERSMAAMSRLRWAVQADYFARRIASDDLTGIDGPADNETGLEDARRGLSRPDRGA